VEGLGIAAAWTKAYAGTMHDVVITMCDETILDGSPTTHTIGRRCRFLHRRNQFPGRNARAGSSWMVDDQ
jgi:hypothetical protein